MDLYRTAKGVWAGTITAARAATKDEGSAPGSWSKVKVPDKKASRIDFLNSLHRAAQEAEDRRTTAPPAPTTRKPAKGSRWRVWGGSVPTFVGATRADTEQEALDTIAATLVAKPSP